MILAIKYDKSEVRVYRDDQRDEAVAFIVRDGYILEGVGVVTNP